MPALAATAGSAFPTRPADRPPVQSGYPKARAHPRPLLGSGRQGQRYRRAAKEVTQEVKGIFIRDGLSLVNRLRSRVVGVVM